MACPAYTDRFTEYLEDTLTPEERADFQRHLAECPACAHDLQTFTATVNVLRAMDMIAPPTSLLERISRALDAQPVPTPVPEPAQRRGLKERVLTWLRARWSWQYAGAMAVAACVLIGFIAVLRHDSSVVNQLPASGTGATQPGGQPPSPPTAVPSVPGRPFSGPGTQPPTAPTGPGAPSTPGAQPRPPIPAVPPGQLHVGQPTPGAQPPQPTVPQPPGMSPGPSPPVPTPGHPGPSVPVLPPYQRRGPLPAATALESIGPTPGPDDIRQKALGNRPEPDQTKPTSKGTPASPAARQGGSPPSSSPSAGSIRPAIPTAEEMRARALGMTGRGVPSGPVAPPSPAPSPPPPPPTAPTGGHDSTSPQPLRYGVEPAHPAKPSASSPDAGAKSDVGGLVSIHFVPPAERYIGQPTVAAVVLQADMDVPRVTMRVETRAGLRVTNAQAKGVIYTGPLTARRRLTLAVNLLAEKSGPHRLRISLSSEVPEANTRLEVHVPDFAPFDGQTASSRETTGEITLVFNETDIRDAMLAIAQQAGLRLEMAPEVSGRRVNVDFRGVPAVAALRVLCHDAGYSLEHKGGVWTVQAR